MNEQTFFFDVENNAVKVNFNSDFESMTLLPPPTPRLAGFPEKQKIASAFSLTPLLFVK